MVALSFLFPLAPRAMSNPFVSSSQPERRLSTWSDSSTELSARPTALGVYSTTASWVVLPSLLSLSPPLLVHVALDLRHDV